MGSIGDSMRGRAGLVAAVVTVALTVGALAAGPEAVIAARRASMHQAGEVMRGLRGDILAHRPVGPLAASARRMDEWADGVVGLFPPGSGQGDTLALATIWANPGGFAALAARLKQATQRLTVAAGAADPAGFRAAYIAVDDACNECHRTFRLR